MRSRWLWRLLRPDGSRDGWTSTPHGRLSPGLRRGETKNRSGKRFGRGGSGVLESDTPPAGPRPQGLSGFFKIFCNSCYFQLIFIPTKDQMSLFPGGYILKSHHKKQPQKSRAEVHKAEMGSSEPSCCF